MIFLIGPVASDILTVRKAVEAPRMDDLANDIAQSGEHIYAVPVTAALNTYARDNGLSALIGRRVRRTGAVLQAVAAPTFAAVQSERIDAAARDYFENVRQSWWADISGAGHAARSVPLNATSRWVVHQAAIAKTLANALSPWASLSETQRRSTINWIILWITTNAPIWYGVMNSNPNLAAPWAAASLTVGAGAHSDIVFANGTARSPDGTYPPVVGVTIPASVQYR